MNKEGFANITLIIVLVIILVGAVGYFVFKGLFSLSAKGEPFVTESTITNTGSQKLPDEITATITTSTSTSTSISSVIRVVTPNGEEVWRIGTLQTIKWTSSQYFKAVYADIKLISFTPPPPCAVGYPCPTVLQKTYVIVRSVNINSGIYSWNVGAVMPYGSNNATIAPNGYYIIQICEIGTDNCDSSNATFIITPANAKH